MKKLNKKIGILIGSGIILSGGVMSVLMKKRTKKLSDIKKDDFDLKLDEIEDDYCIKDNFHKENIKDVIEKEETNSLVDEYSDYESKTEEEKQKEYRDLSIDIMNLLLKEVITMSENINEVKEAINRVDEAKALVQELENCKEEIISLWEHLEELLNHKEELDRG